MGTIYLFAGLSELHLYGDLRVRQGDALYHTLCIAFATRSDLMRPASLRLAISAALVEPEHLHAIVFLGQ